MINTFFIDDFVEELQINSPTDSLQLGYLLATPIEGLDTPPIRMSSYNRVGENGLVIPSAFYDGRVITIPGTIYANNPTDYLQRRKDLSYVCRILKDANGYPVSQKFRFTTCDDEEYFFYGRPKVTFAITANKMVRFLLTITCPDPFIYQAEAQSSGSISVPIPGGALYPATYPLTYAPSSGGSGSLTIDGNEATYPILTLTGIVTDPYIVNQATGEFMQLDVTTAEAGDVIVINMAEKTITLNGTSILSAKIGDSTWWSLVPGLNNIQFSTSSTSDTGSLSIAWFNALLGV